MIIVDNGSIRAKCGNGIKAVFYEIILFRTEFKQLVTQRSLVVVLDYFQTSGTDTPVDNFFSKMIEPGEKMTHGDGIFTVT